MQEHPAGEPRRNEKPLFRTLLEPFAALALVFAGVFVAAASYGLLTSSAGGDGELALPAALLGITVQSLLLAGMGRWLRHRHGLDRERGTAVSRPWLPALLGGPAVYATSLAVAVVAGFAGLEIREQAWLADQLADPARMAVLAPWIVVIAPWAEEIFFRGYVQRLVEGRLGAVAGLGLSAALFAAIHWNPSGLPLYFAIGLVLGLLYNASRRLWVPMVAHAVHNALVLLGFLMLPHS